MEIFQKRVKQERLSCRLTQREMAQKLHITQPSYIRYENGNSEPTLENLALLADILDVSVDYLLGRSDF